MKIQKEIVGVSGGTGRVGGGTGQGGCVRRIEVFILFYFFLGGGVGGGGGSGWM